MSQLKTVTSLKKVLANRNNAKKVQGLEPKMERPGLSVMLSSMA